MTIVDGRRPRRRLNGDLCIVSKKSRRQGLRPLTGLIFTFQGSAKRVGICSYPTLH